MKTTNKYTCKKCGYTFEQEVSPAEIAFAKNTGSKKLISVWECEKCGSDNTTEIEIPE